VRILLHSEHGGGTHRQFGRSFVLACRTPGAVRWVRACVERLVEELDGARVPGAQRAPKISLGESIEFFVKFVSFSLNVSLVAGLAGALMDLRGAPVASCTVSCTETAPLHLRQLDLKHRLLKYRAAT
jgi:hypothetical protein